MALVGRTVRFALLGSDPRRASAAAFDERHVSSPSLQTCDEDFVVGVAFDKLGKMLAVLDKIDPAALADHEEDIVRRLARRLADDAKQASRKRTLLLVGPAVARIP